MARSKEHRGGTAVLHSARFCSHRASPHESADGEVRIVGRDPKFLATLDLVRQVADTDATVLITGECGTGKEAIARALHQDSRRGSASMIAVNCGAIPESLEESELFGHVQGAFTGATLRKLGRFEAADGGTILLDEISEASKSLQVKLLRILQSGEYTPVGTVANRYCDVRVVAATNRDLSQLVDRGEFRRDLYYRLNVIRLELPPLRQRKADIPLLAAYFLERFGQVYGKPKLRFDDEASDLLLAYNYPGNVRELENVIQRCVIICQGESVRVVDLPAEILRNEARADRSNCSTFHEGKQRAIERFERNYLTRALVSTGGIISRAANLAGLSERIFHAKLKKHGISGRSFRTPAATG